MRARLKVSKAGIELIKSFEGLRQTAARLPDGRWTLGYGHTFSAREGARVTQEDADALLRFDLLPIVDAVNNVVLVPLNQNQFDALVSFCFNIGVDNFAQSTVLKRVNEGRMTEAALAMDSWRSAEFNGQTYVLAPLIRRRAAEKNLFLTPEETAGNAPTLLVRPVEDMQGEATQTPAEVQAPDRGGILSAYPVGQPEPAPQPAPQTYPSQIPLPYASPYANPIPAAAQREVIDLNAFTPRPVETAPVADEPVMSAETQAALARAHEEQRLREEAQRQAESLAAAQAAEAARIQEEQRQAALRAEQARLEQERLERERLEREHQDRLQAERDRIEQMRQEQLRLEQERQERERLERERIEREQAETARLERERAEQARLEQARLEQARLELERVERERAEQIRLEQERAERERQERDRLQREEQARAAAAAAPAPVSDEDAEKQRKAEAAAALMRLYSPYGGGALGRPLGSFAPKPAPVAPPAPSEPVIVPDVKPHAESEPAQEFTNQSLIAPSATESEPIEDSRAEAQPAESKPVVVPFAPVQSPSNMPPPVITALNPYARPLTPDEVVEVPRPAPVDLAKNKTAPAPQPVVTPAVAPHWREQLQRPLPQDYRPPEEAAPEHQPSLLQSAQAARYDAYDEDNADWSMDGRIAVTSDEVHVEHRSWWSMLTSTLKWVFISLIGMGSLGVAAASYWKSRDPTVIRNGFFHDYMTLSVITAAVGILCVSISVWLIMRRLGGLKD